MRDIRIRIMIRKLAASLALSAVLAAGAGSAFAQPQALPGGWFGGRLAPLPPAMAAAHGVDHGVLLTGTMEGSPSNHAGLKAQDIVLSIDGQTVSAPDDMRNIFLAHKPGDRVNVAVIDVAGGGTRKTIPITLGVRPPQP